MLWKSFYKQNFTELPLWWLVFPSQFCRIVTLEVGSFYGLPFPLTCQDTLYRSLRPAQARNERLEGGGSLYTNKV